ncbi:phasin family protein [Mesorhizobium sp. BAC0120]|uniref:phasin family protein n=1 Tax=Mesorhizobium sp. BAC0120 TaxID=3090670 RepID=UPI00298D1250|nr:phasin family protein [Mesorhizobium sp. BAC0120]MDW6020296.1 phasin family protein [Mesorhizobium sp. BAC0120]
MQAATGPSQTTFSLLSFPQLGNLQTLGFATARLQLHAFKAAMRYNIEGLAFLQHRYEQDVKFVDDLAASDEFKDAFDVVTAFLQNAATEYANEASKLTSIGYRLASESARKVREEAERATADIAVASVA